MAITSENRPTRARLRQVVRVATTSHPCERARLIEKTSIVLIGCSRWMNRTSLGCRSSRQPTQRSERGSFWNSRARVCDAMCRIPTMARQRTSSSFWIYSRTLRDDYCVSSPRRAEATTFTPTRRSESRPCTQALRVALRPWRVQASLLDEPKRPRRYSSPQSPLYRQDKYSRSGSFPCCCRRP